MAEELEFTVKLDAAPAKREMENLEKEGQRLGGSMSKRVRGAIQTGMRATGLDAFAPTNLIKGSLNSLRNNGLQDIIDESTRLINQDVNRFFIGERGQEARAAKSARDQTYDTFKYEIAYGDGGIKPHIYDHYQVLKNREMVLEKGYAKFMRDDTFQGPTIKDLGEDLFSRISGAIEDGFNSLKSFFTGG